MPTFIARSGSFNNLKLTGLSNSVQTNIISIDTASGQLYYAPASSAGITITNNQNGNLLTATGGTTIRGSIYLNIKDLNSGPDYPLATQAVLTLAPETAIVSSGSRFKWVTIPFTGPPIEGFMTSSAYKMTFGRGLVTVESSTNVNNGTNVPALYLGNYNDTSSFVNELIGGIHPVFVIGSGTSNTDRRNCFWVYEDGGVYIKTLYITNTLSFTGNAVLQVNGTTGLYGPTFITSLTSSFITSSVVKATSFTGSFNGSFTGDGSGLTNVSLPSPPYGGQYTYQQYGSLDQYVSPTVDGNGQLANSNIYNDGYFLGLGTPAPIDFIDIQSFDPAYGINIYNGSIKLGAVDPLPSGQLGSIAVSGSSLWFHNGSIWKEVNLL